MYTILLNARLFSYLFFPKAWYETLWCAVLVSSYAGKIVNIRRLDEVINSINGWYMERGLFGLVSAWSFVTYSICDFILQLALFCDQIFIYNIICFDHCCRFQVLRFFQGVLLGYKFRKRRLMIYPYVFVVGRKNLLWSLIFYYLQTPL